MAEPNNSAAAPAINTNIESGNFDEKAGHHNTQPTVSKPKVEDDAEEEDEDIDALIEDLESQDGGEDEEEEEEGQGVGMGRTIPEEMLNTDTRLGLTESEVSNRRRKYGLNQMKEEKENLLLKFFGFFVGPIQFVMEAAAVLAAGLEDWVDFGVIIGLLLLNAAVGFIQEYQAGSIVDELKKTLALKAVVLRDGTLKEIEAPQVVPGDILQVEEGTIIPADGRIVTDDAFLQVDQSALTGESLAVDKHKNDNCFASSAVKRGEAFMVVTATGDNTFVGRAAALVSQASGGTGHFTEVLNGIGTVLLVLVILTLLVVWVSSFYRSNPIVEILGFTLAITIVGVPVGLPAVVTTTMAVGAAFLAKKKAIVQKLSAIESLAGVEILCSDKTGTLTKNKLSLSEPFTVAGVEPDDLMLTACLAASRKKKGMDAIDKAFLKALKYYPRAKGVLSKYIVKEFYPFDPVSKKVTAIVESPQGEIITCVKGAPLFVLKTVAEDHPVPDEIDQAYKNKVAEFATRGFRSLGVARKRGEGAWEILGIMPCSDPPRHDTARTINEAKRMGLSIKMLTGDAVGIARETSRQLGLGTNVYNAERLGLGGGGDMPGSEVYDFVEAADGFAEVFPQHKYNVVEILQQRGYLVGMTGDGVNDAPSLKKADTGIAVEGASDAARSAADIVFLAPGLGAIIDALKTSRQIFHRMYAYVVYRIALSLHLEIYLGLWIAILNRSLNIELVVFIAIFADVATLAIAYDNAPYSMSPVKWNLPKLWGMSVILGVILAVGTWITVTTLYVNGEDGGIVQNNGNLDEVLFLEISLTENWLIFITRANGPFWSSIPSWQLTGAILIVDILATLFCIFGWFEDGYTHIVAVVRIWIFSFGVFSIMGGVYYFLQDSTGFDNLMHGKSPKGSQKQRSLEDFDPEKQRYFKVENGKTAPTNAAWSSTNVKRRKLRDEDAATALQHLNLAKSRIRRARVLHEPLTGGFFAREYGAVKDDMRGSCFAEGLTNKGCILLAQLGVGSPVTQVKRMFIGGHDYKTGMCTVYTEPRHNEYEAHCVAPAPASSSLACTVGTNRGIVQWDRSFTPSAWPTPPASFRADPTRYCPGNLFRDVFTVDFHPSHGEVMRFGGRPGALFTADTRVPFTKWSHLKLPSAITHLRCLDGGNQVLVAGLQNRLGVYDLRFVRSHRGTGDDGGRMDIDDSDRDRAQPVIQFEHYRNDAHIDIGFAYNAATGVVAAAHGDVPGTVALYSENRMDVPIIQSLRFQTFPGDHTPTLFVGSDRRGGITAFSFGVDDLEDEA
ncbi:plasma-membrane proton-e [Xylaria grammica]|nr:plasma-membrane proton-e [Xylaria grammica]